MCFSAQASFATAAFLTPIGFYCLKKTFQFDKRYLLLASVPVLFAIQQAFEGGLWLALAGGNNPAVMLTALGFLFFADFLWPLLIPLACAAIEVNKAKQRAFVALGFLGGVFGASLYLPLLIEPDWLSVRIEQGSIFYQLVQLYDRVFPHIIVRLVYALIVALPLLLSSVSRVRKLGWLLAISIAISAWFFAYAFVSVWCFFAAIISAYIYWIVKDTTR